MSSFIYVTDSHIGADPIGYHQQPSYVKRISEIIDVLEKWLRKHRDVDFVLHGGDLVDEMSDAIIDVATELFNRLSVPTYLCLGNHDLSEENAIAHWMDRGASFFPEGTPCYTIVEKKYALHVIPSHWCDSPYFWDRKVQNANFTTEQLEQLESNLLANADKIQVLATHNPVFGLPMTQTGFEQPHHPPDKMFTEAMTQIVKRHPSLKVVLGAHNHMNMNFSHSGVNYVTASSLTESPFDFKYFQVDDLAISMSTISLSGDVEFTVEYDFEKTFVQGRECDRRFEIS